MYNLRIPRFEGKSKTFTVGPRNLNNEVERPNDLMNLNTALSLGRPCDIPGKGQ